MSAEPSFDADLARDCRHLIGKEGQRCRHIVDRFGQGGHLTLGLDGEILYKVAICDCSHDFHDAAHLFREIGCHHVDGVSEILPSTCHARNSCLATQPTLRSDFAGDAGNLGGKGIQLIDHRIDGVFQFQYFPLYRNRDLARKVAAGDGSRHLRDVAHLCRQIGGKQIHVVGEVLPCPSDTGYLRLTAQFAVGSDFTCDAGDLGCERAKLFDHRIERFL